MWHGDAGGAPDPATGTDRAVEVESVCPFTPCLGDDSYTPLVATRPTCVGRKDRSAAGIGLLIQ